MSGTTAAERDIVRKLARGSFLSRLKAGGRQPLKLIAVPRDHVQGDRQRGDALLAGRFKFGSEILPLASLDFAALGIQGALASAAAGLFLASRPCRGSEPGERRQTGRSPRRALAARPWHPRRRCVAAGPVGRADPVLDGLRALRAVEPRRRLSLGLAQHAGAGRALSRFQCRQGAAGPDAHHRLGRCRRRRIAGQRRRSARGTGRSRPRPRARHRPVRGWRPDQPLSARANAAGRPARAPPRGLFRGQADASRRDRGGVGGIACRASWRHHGRWRLVELAGRQSRRSGAARGFGRRLRPSRASAAPGARLGLSAPLGLGDGPGARRGASAAAQDGRERRGLDSGVRNVRRLAAAGGQLRRSRAACRPRSTRSWSRPCARPPRTARSH